MTIQTLINNEILKPCPFCGREVTLISTSQTKEFIFSHKGLRNCPFYQFRMSWECAKSIKEATELWNRREAIDYKPNKIELEVIGGIKEDFEDCCICKYSKLPEESCKVAGCIHAWDRMTDLFERDMEV